MGLPAGAGSVRDFLPSVSTVSNSLFPETPPQPLSHKTPSTTVIVVDPNPPVRFKAGSHADTTCSDKDTTAQSHIALQSQTARPSPPRPEPAKTPSLVTANVARNSRTMSPMIDQSNNWSSNYGEDVVHQVNVLASCYIVDPTANLKGIHYCTTGVTGTLLPTASS